MKASSSGVKLTPVPGGWTQFVHVFALRTPSEASQSRHTSRSGAPTSCSPLEVAAVASAFPDSNGRGHISDVSDRSRFVGWTGRGRVVAPLRWRVAGHLGCGPVDLIQSDGALNCLFRLRNDSVHAQTLSLSLSIRK